MADTIQNKRPRGRHDEGSIHQSRENTCSSDEQWESLGGTMCTSHLGSSGFQCSYPTLLRLSQLRGLLIMETETRPRETSQKPQDGESCPMQKKGPVHYSSYLEHINRPPHRVSADLNQHGCLQQGRDKHELLEREDCTIFKSPILSYVVQKGHRSSTCSQRVSRKLAKSQDEGACPWVTRESCNDTEDHR